MAQSKTLGDYLLESGLMLLTIVCFGAAITHFIYVLVGPPQYYVAMHGSDSAAAVWVSGFAAPMFYAAGEMLRNFVTERMRRHLA